MNNDIKEDGMDFNVKPVVSVPLYPESEEAPLEFEPVKIVMSMSDFQLLRRLAEEAAMPRVVYNVENLNQMALDAAEKTRASLARIISVLNSYEYMEMGVDM